MSALSQFWLRQYVAHMGICYPCIGSRSVLRAITDSKGHAVRLTQFSNLALRILMYAGLKGRKPSAVSEMAGAYGASYDHLKKAAAELCHLGTLKAVRGRYGGFGLVNKPEQINIGQVVRQTERVNALAECFTPESCTCPIASECVFRIALEEALEAFLAVLDRYTLADLISNRHALMPLLGLSPDGPGAACMNPERLSELWPVQTVPSLAKPPSLAIPHLLDSSESKSKQNSL